MLNNHAHSSGTRIGEGYQTLSATEVSLQVQKRPPKSCTPMMAKIKKNSPTTMETLAMDASDRVTDRKTSIMPGLLVNVLQQTAPVTCIEVKDQ